MQDLRNVMTNTIPISSFNRGLAGQIFEEVKNTGAKVVLKNNVAECVLLSPEEYVKLMDEVNDARLLLMANERLKKYSSLKAVSQEDALKELNIDEKDLTGWEDVEIE